MAKLGDIFVKQIVGEWGNECNNESNGVFVLRTTNFSNSGVINYDKVVKRDIPDNKVEEKKLKYGDIILEKSGGTDKTPVGRVVFCDNKIESDVYLCNNFTQAMRVDNSIAIPKYVFYLMYYFHQIGITDLLQSKTTGIRNLRLRDYLNTDIKLPNLAEQEHCVIYLDKLTVLISLRQQQLEKLDELVKSRFIELFGEPVVNPKGFPCYTVGEVIDFQGGSQPDKKYFEYEPSPDNIRLIQIRDYKSDKYITYIPKTMAKRFCTVDDIMIGRYGPPIFQILKGIEGSFNVALMKATPKMGNREFVRQFLKQDCLLEYLEGLSKRTAGQDGIQMDKLKAYPFPYPPIELQEQFAAFVKHTDKSKVAVQASITKCHYLTKKGVNTHA